MPARFRDPDLIVEMPGQETPDLPAELIDAINLISDPDLPEWKKTISTKRQAKLIKRRQQAINAIANYQFILDNLDNYIRFHEPEPKWSTQKWINFILHGDIHEHAPAGPYREVEVGGVYFPPAVENHGAPQPDQALLPQPDVPLPPPQGPPAPPEVQPDPVIDLDVAGAPSVSRTSSDSSTITVRSDSSTLTADEFFSPPVSPTTSRSHGSPARTASTGHPSSSMPGTVELLPGLPVLSTSLAPPAPAASGVGSALRRFTRQHLVDLGIVMPDYTNIYPNERKSKKK